MLLTQLDFARVFSCAGRVYLYVLQVHYHSNPNLLNMSDHVRNGKMSFVPGIWTDSSSCDTLVASPAYCKIVMNSRYGRRRPVARHLSIRATMLMLSSFSSVYSDLAQKSIVLETLGPILPRSAIFPIGRQRIMGSRPHIPSPPFLRVGNFQSTDVILPHGQNFRKIFKTQSAPGLSFVVCLP